MIIRKIHYFLLLLIVLISCNEVSNNSSQKVASVIDTIPFDKIACILLYYSDGDLHSFVMLSAEADSNRKFSILDTLVFNAYAEEFILDTNVIHQIGSYIHSTKSKEFREKNAAFCWWSFYIIDKEGRTTAYTHHSNYDAKKIIEYIEKLLKDEQYNTTPDVLDFFQNWKKILYVPDSPMCI